MADISLVRGDSAQFDLTILQDGGSPVNLTGAVIKFAVKKSRSDPNSAAVVFKTSYDSADIAVTSASQGTASVYLQPADTIGKNAGQLEWEVEVTKQGSTVAAVAGTLNVTAGSATINAAGVTGLASVQPGMVLVPAGASPNNVKPVTVISVDTTAQTITTDYDDWITDAALAFSCKQGDRHTPTGLSGTFDLVADVVQ